MLGATIRRLRTARGVGLGELAERAGITKGGLSHIETGRHNPSQRTLRAIADGLGVRIADLYAEDPETPNASPAAGVSA